MKINEYKKFCDCSSDWQFKAKAITNFLVILTVKYTKMFSLGPESKSPYIYTLLTSEQNCNISKCK